MWENWERVFGLFRVESPWNDNGGRFFNSDGADCVLAKQGKKVIFGIWAPEKM